MNPLNPLFVAVAWVMEQIHTGLSTFLPPASGLTWVLTIVILVVLMRLLLVPLFVKQMHATRKMSALAPQIQELRKKYKNDKQTLNQETMRLYKENGANPLAGCLPLLGQLPVFFALFSVLRAISVWHAGETPPYGLSHAFVLSAQQADIFGAHLADKFLFPLPGETLQARIVILIAVLISVATTYLTVRQSTKRGMTPQMTPDNPMAASQKYMAYIVPLFALSGLYWQFGLVLYWVTTNVWTLGQQYVLFKRYPMPAVAGAPAVVQGKVVPPGKSSGSGKPGSGKAAPADRVPADGKPAQARKPARGAAKPAAAKPPADAGAGQGSANGSGVLRRLTRGRPEPQPEPQPAAPDTKLVRQQRTRQSRSKRSGKR
ncbi:MAG TPA: membrane protein insertase YidC [Streptosporangiaceae bacterium]|nr:membrane protein insertase YidC [Streptosporangiaceae bacterium]